MKSGFIAGLIIGLAISSNASAATVFFQDFNNPSLLTLGPTNNGLSLTSLPLPNITVSGNIDVVGSPNNYGIPQPTSSFVDLDGTTGPGKLTVAPFGYGSGDKVTLSFYLGGNERNFPVDLFTLAFTNGAILASNVSGTGYFSNPLALASLFANGFLDLNLASNDNFQLSSISFTANGSGTFGFSLGTDSSDTVGPLVDEIKLEVASVPGPVVGAGLPGLVIALGALVALRRRRMFAA